MQIGATLIAAQQAARQAQTLFQARFQAAPVTPEANFSVALEKEKGFAPLPLKQAVAPPAAPQSSMAMRPGSLLDIKI
jgi:hypothetical protein